MFELNKAKLIDIIIVNWNTGDQLRNCLVSIKKTSYMEANILNIVVVDNGSKDNSLSNIREIIPSLKLIENSENRGFAAACNQGTHYCESKYILFLNPDTIITNNSLSVPLNYMENDKNLSYAACGIQMLNENGQISHSCARFPGLLHFLADIVGISKLFPQKIPSLHMSDWGHNQNRDIDHVIGAFYFVRRLVFENLNGFDEHFFVYLEDLDLSKRIYENGYKIRFIMDAQCTHKGGGASEQVKDKRLFYSLQSKIIFGFKHLNILSAICLLICTLFMEPFSRLIMLMFSGSTSNIKNTIKAYIMLYYSIPNIYKLVKQ